MLENGHAEEETAPGGSALARTSVFGTPTYGDLNGDGTPDAALLLTDDGGGSGTFYYVAVAVRTKNGYLGTNAVLLGDRIAPDTLAIWHGLVVANYATRRASEPFVTPPSEATTTYLSLSGANLSALGPFDAGTQVLAGTYTYGATDRAFTTCMGEVYAIAPRSAAAAALDAIYRERMAEGGGARGTFAVVAGTIVPGSTGMPHELVIGSVLSSPRNETCADGTSGTVHEPSAASSTTRPASSTAATGTTAVTGE
jgi:hypothetical protein